MENVLPIRKSFTLSLLLHIVIFTTLIVSFVFSKPAKPPTALNMPQAEKIVQAVSVNQEQVDQEIAKLKQQQNQQQSSEKARLAAMKRQAADAAKQKQRQEQQLAKLKAQQEALVKQNQEKLAQLEKQQQVAQKQLATIEQAKQQEQKKLNEQKKLKEQQKLKAQQDLKIAAEKSLQQQIAQEQTQLNAAKEQQINNELAKYTALILQAISQQWIIPTNSNRSATSILEITLAPGGVVKNVVLKKSSGDVLLDRSAITAVYKASPLPVPSDPALFKRMQEIQLKVKPEDVVG
jgi:colicin import membrane protein